MPKPHTFPTLYNDVLKLNISKLKEWGYLQSHNMQTGIVTWSTNGERSARIRITVNMSASTPYVELDYSHGEKPINYKAYLTALPSNLGKGLVWYFVCPETRKRCRILYSIGGYFLHREAFSGCMYESQTYSKKTRVLIKLLDPHFKSEMLYSELYKKHLKKSYAGKPTKKYKRLVQEIEKAESIAYYEIERAMIK